LSCGCPLIGIGTRPFLLFSALFRKQEVGTGHSRK
jgi:hypothetical protein